MKLDDVPQDPDSAYGGHSKLLYAVDDSGHYQGAQSAGWEPESYATHLAVAELQAQEAEAHAAWQRGEQSPLKCLMYRYRMDEAALAQIAGLWKWRVRRHFRPEIYRRLSDSLLARYAEAFGLTVDVLRRYERELP